MTKIYLAGSCGPTDRSRMTTIGNFLRSRNFEVYCPFELKIPHAWNMSQEEWAKKVFDADRQAINDCEIMIVISVGRESTAGTNWEQGYGFAKGKTIYVFQITDKPTSLMTYWGCNVFKITNFNQICEDLIDILERGSTSQNPCSTILT